MPSLPVRPYLTAPVISNTQRIAAQLGWTRASIQDHCHRYRTRIEGIQASGREPTAEERRPQWKELACTWSVHVGKRIVYNVPDWAVADYLKQPTRRPIAAGWLTPEQACRILGVVRGMLYYWMNRGELTYKKEGNRRYLLAADVERKRIAQRQSGAAKTATPA